MVVDQRPGAGGIIAADTVASRSPWAIRCSSRPARIRSTRPCIRSSRTASSVAGTRGAARVDSFLVIVNPSVPAKSMQELVQLARAKPGQLNCAHSGPGTTAHLGCEMLKSSARIEMVSVSYKGTVPAVVDVISGRSQLMFAVMQGGLPHVQAGKLRAVAVPGRKRAAALPEHADHRRGGVSRRGLHHVERRARARRNAEAMIARLNAEFNRVLKLPECRNAWRASGSTRPAARRRLSAPS